MLALATWTNSEHFSWFAVPVPSSFASASYSASQTSVGYPAEQHQLACSIWASIPPSASFAVGILIIVAASWHSS